MIILFILIGEIFLMININSFLGSWVVSSFCIDPFLLAAIIPIKSYSNADANKVQILSDNQNKSGIYKFKNLKNGKRYIGSSENLRARFRLRQQYFNVNYLFRNTWDVYLSCST